MIPENDAAPADAPKLDREELRRYDRHLLLPEVGLEGQLKLKGAKVLVVGAGGLGSPLCLYLAAAGVGRIGIVDFDAVDVSNLQRQVLYDARSLGRPKASAARERLLGLNPGLRIDAVETRLDPGNVRGILDEYDLAADCTDNFKTRYLINDACAAAGKPDVYGSVFRFEGQVAVLGTRQGPCYRCLHPEPPPPELAPSCVEGGVLGALPGIIGALQAAEVLKLILGIGSPLIGRLLLFDALRMESRILRLPKDPNCPACSGKSLPLAASDSPSCRAAEPAETAPEISAKELRRRLRRDGGIRLLDVREPAETASGGIPDSRRIPLAALTDRIDELNAADEIVVYCKTGIRSAQAVRLLSERGFFRARSLAGGIDAWIGELDPGRPFR
ncbi:MAG: molybdopterin-synthase adenylyltransferase MoeB [Elusimicrobia bacterium]|nr:molybdopterin-synthase adenylyltransferase MoeB [Elusimicrobiota bacterium]